MSLHTSVGILSDGVIPGPVVSWTASASLMALKKKDKSHRPVGVGEKIHRLAAKVLLAAVPKDITDDLQPAQLGFGTRNGCGAIVHSVRKLLHDHREDEKPAPPHPRSGERLHQIVRSCFRKEVRWLAPRLARYSSCSGLRGFCAREAHKKATPWGLFFSPCTLHGAIAGGRGGNGTESGPGGLVGLLPRCRASFAKSLKLFLGGLSGQAWASSSTLRSASTSHTSPLQPPRSHPQPRQAGRSDTTNVLQTSVSQSCRRPSMEWAEKLMAQLARLQSPATALVLLRFRLGWCASAPFHRPPDLESDQDGRSTLPSSPVWLVGSPLGMEPNSR